MYVVARQCPCPPQADYNELPPFPRVITLWTAACRSPECDEQRGASASPLTLCSPSSPPCGRYRRKYVPGTIEDTSGTAIPIGKADEVLAHLWRRTEEIALHHVLDEVGEFVSTREMLAHYSAMSDEELRRLFADTLEHRASAAGQSVQVWRSWLVDRLLRYFHEHPPLNVTDQCRYVAFVLRYLAAIEAGLSSPVRVQQVLSVMERRPEVVTALLFGHVEMRRNALRAAVGSPVTWHDLSLEPHQQASVQTFMRRFEARGNDSGLSAFDDSTVAKWSRDLIPELEALVLEQIRPARQMAQGEVVRKMVSRSPSRTGVSDRATLVDLLQQFESEALQANYGIALSALNDFDRRTEVDQRQFKGQQRAFVVLLVLLAVLVSALVVGNQIDLPEGMRSIALLGAFAAGLGGAVTILYLFVRIIVGTGIITEHITRTRTDIQTLQQLVERMAKTGAD